MNLLSIEKVALLADFLTNRSRSFEDTRREFVQNFHRNEWIMVTKLLAVALHNRPFECTGQSVSSTTAAELFFNDTDGKVKEQTEKTGSIPIESANFPTRCYAFEHAYASVILSMTDVSGIVAGNELAKLEYLLKERTILSTKDGQQKMSHSSCCDPLETMKALWLFGGKISSDILSMNVNEYFSMAAGKLSALFLVPPLSEISQPMTVHPLFGMPRVINKPHREGNFLSPSSMCEFLSEAQASGISCIESAYPTRTALSFTNLADMCQYLFASTELSTDSQSHPAEEAKSVRSECAAFLASLRKGCSIELGCDEESAMINFTVRCPGVVGMSGITPANVIALVNSENAKIAAAILTYYSSTRLFSLFLSPFINAKNLNPRMYELLLCLSVEKRLPESFLVEFLELGFKEFSVGLTTLEEFSSENKGFAKFCADLLKHCAIRPSLIFDDVCRYCVFHQCAPETQPLFSLVVNCSS
ncbi:patatin-like phospholipase [Perkinsela sp. CCAP 1560/4]|nr:patatin-like phospholipase [Perkinsela sp. CCAP 1560/4]|eukprot:KNH01763.1 patatin-like phospholipase [Perkinsela sp. CCAP 1560/4]